jgi:hypothetical protein
MKSASDDKKQPLFSLELKYELLPVISGRILSLSDGTLETISSQMSSLHAYCIYPLWKYISMRS